MFAPIVAPVLGACLPLAVEVDFTAFPPPARFPLFGGDKFHHRRYAVVCDAGRCVAEVRSRPKACAVDWAQSFVADVDIDGGEAVSVGGVAVVLTVRGQPVTAVEYQSAFVRPAIRWVARPDHLFALRPKK